MIIVPVVTGCVLVCKGSDNMNNYIHILDENGKRITSIVDNMLSPIGEDELLKQAQQQYQNANQYVFGDDNMLDQFLNGKAYVNGKFIDIPVVLPKPTKADIKNQINKINVQISELRGISECAISVDGVNEYDVFIGDKLVTMKEEQFLNYFDELTNKRAELLQQYKEVE